jgi:hypothetical protein
MQERPTATVDERKEIPAIEAPAPRYSPFVRWLGWLLITAIVAGGAWLIWDNFISDGVVEVGTPPALAEIDLRINPELKTAVPSLLMVPSIDLINPHESPEVMRVPMAPSLSSIDPHESPEVMRVPMTTFSSETGETWGTVDLAKWDLRIIEWSVSGRHWVR